MTTRHDLTQVRPLGAYAAKRCPYRIQLDILRPSEPEPDRPELLRRFEDGQRFEAECVAALRAVAASDWVFVDESRPDAADATLAAMASGAPVIVGANLPPDPVGKRSGKPDLLVREGDGYVPIDIKHHRTLEPAPKFPARTSPLARPWLAAAVEGPGQGLKRNKDDALQLAHYHRMLLAMGRAAEVRAGGILGTEGVVTWYWLDELMWKTPARSDGKRSKVRTSLECYDFEFDFRLDMAALAHGHREDADRALELEPVQCDQCPDCPWRLHCSRLLTAGSGDPSLLPGIGYRPWRALRELGIVDRAGVAALDHATAELGARGVDLAKVLAGSAEVDAETPLAELFKRATKQVRLLAEAGIATAAEARERLDPRTARLEGAGWVPKAILNARAALGPEPVYRVSTAIEARVPRADLELDVDMENVAAGVYLWGVHVHDRGETGLVEPGYLPFVTWDPLDLAAERRLFVAFWTWLADLRARAEAAGHTVCLYAWHATAEESQIHRALAGTELAQEVRAFLDSEQWVDLEAVFKRHWLTGGSSGLKQIAPLAGHAWEVDDPGGARSMVLYAQATGEDARTHAAARTWLLDYNRGDVEATLAIRRWLDEQGGTFAPVPVG